MVILLKRETQSVFFFCTQSSDVIIERMIPEAINMVTSKFYDHVAKLGSCVERQRSKLKISSTFATTS